MAPGKPVDDSKKSRHAVIEDSMNDVIKQHTGAPIGPVDIQEIAAPHRKIGVEVNARGVPFTPGELVTAAGIVMEETGAQPMYAPGMMSDSLAAPRRIKSKRSTSYFIVGDGRWKG